MQITLAYTLETDDEILEGCTQENPMKLRLGSGQLSPLLESQLVGKKVGDVIEARFDSSLVFGPHNPALKFQISVKKIPEHLRALDLGDGFESFGPDRKKHFFRLIEKNDQNVVFDGNPCDEKTVLLFKAEILSFEERAQESSQLPQNL